MALGGGVDHLDKVFQLRVLRMERVHFNVPFPWALLCQTIKTKSSYKKEKKSDWRVNICWLRWLAFNMRIYHFLLSCHLSWPTSTKTFQSFQNYRDKKKKKKSLHSWACQCYTYLMFKSNCVRACQKHSFQFYLPYTALSLTMSLLKVWKILPSVFHSTSKITIINSFLTGNRISW